MRARGHRADDARTGTRAARSSRSRCRPSRHPCGSRGGTRRTRWTTRTRCALRERAVVPRRCRLRSGSPRLGPSALRPRVRRRVLRLRQCAGTGTGDRTREGLYAAERGDADQASGDGAARVRASQRRRRPGIPLRCDLVRGLRGKGAVTRRRTAVQPQRLHLRRRRIGPFAHWHRRQRPSRRGIRQGALQDRRDLAHRQHSRQPLRGDGPARRSRGPVRCGHSTGAGLGTPHWLPPLLRRSRGPLAGGFLLR